MDNLFAVAKRGYPSEAHDRVDILAVIVLGTNNDCAAYVGSGSPEWVARMGDKLAADEVAQWFPAFEQYRAAHNLTYRG